MATRLKTGSVVAMRDLALVVCAVGAAVHQCASQGAARLDTIRPVAALDEQTLEITSRRIDQLLAGFATEQAMRKRLVWDASRSRPGLLSPGEIAGMANDLALADSVGAEASGFKLLQYVILRERVRAYLAGAAAARYGWSYSPAEVAVLRRRARELIPLAPPDPRAP